MTERETWFNVCDASHWPRYAGAPASSGRQTGASVPCPQAPPPPPDSDCSERRLCRCALCSVLSLSPPFLSCCPRSSSVQCHSPVTFFPFSASFLLRRPYSTNCPLPSGARSARKQTAFILLWLIFLLLLLQLFCVYPGADLTSPHFTSSDEPLGRLRR